MLNDSELMQVADRVRRAREAKGYWASCYLEDVWRLLEEIELHRNALAKVTLPQ